MADKLKPDDIVMARRKLGAGAVSIGNWDAVLTRRPGWQPTPTMILDGLVAEGDEIPMLALEAAGRDDFEIVGHESLDATYFEPTAQAAETPEG